MDAAGASGGEGAASEAGVRKRGAGEKLRKKIEIA